MHQAKYKKKGKMAPESEIIEVVEKICGRATFDGFDSFVSFGCYQL